MVGKAEIMDARGFRGQVPTSATRSLERALAVLDVIEEDGLSERAAALGDAMRARMESWQQRWPQIEDVQGLGAMITPIELVLDPETKQPAPDLATEVVDRLTRNGLLLLKAGIYSNCIRVLTPLVLADAELDEALGVWEQALEYALSS